MKEIQKRMDKDNRFDRCFISYTNKKIILFTDKSMTKVEKVLPLNEENAYKLIMNTLMFFKWS